jgi:hypothetical protein
MFYSTYVVGDPKDLSERFELGLSGFAFASDNWEKEINVNDYPIEEIKEGIRFQELTVNDTLFRGTHAARDLSVRPS